jgi:hypothetical protein
MSQVVPNNTAAIETSAIAATRLMNRTARRPFHRPRSRTSVDIRPYIDTSGQPPELATLVGCGCLAAAVNLRFEHHYTLYGIHEWIDNDLPRRSC